VNVVADAPEVESDGSDVESGFTPGTLVGAVVIAGLEALALLAGAAFTLVSTVTGSPDDLGRALLLAALAIAGAALLVTAGRGLLRLRPSARTPVLIMQLLALPVAYSLWFQADIPAYGAPILVAALVTIYLLFAPPSRAALDRAE
jgi:hypothetical protein